MYGYSIVEFEPDGYQRDVTWEYRQEPEQEWRDDFYDCPEYADYVETWG